MLCLQPAAVYPLDEASIFTIHGFCQRGVKWQFAVSFKRRFRIELVT